ncbi:ABC transporter ATP-binding protein [Methylobrevis albus]|uniref:ABC transporter ATP-binding protein n=1 Tax=Methylobrevis albus TaxID=2793297 RepID=A0A931I3Y9_9HYPH|nr:ABC transporter ATP-binding protein [Methylobrevis albus]MBH0238863.1 ABC transporter ATP-binding protein [Methylobrevis albus]
MADVSIRNVTKRFGDTTAVSDLSIDIADGEFIVLLGPTGAGKTTTLRLIAGLEAPDAGRLSIAGRDVTKAPPAARDVAFVFQQYSLYPHLSVYDNLAFPLRSPIRPMAKAAIDAKVRTIAAMLKIEDKLANKATKLSGGQMQRVAIGRALVRDPAIYLMDEPLSSLDAKLRADLRLELKRIQAELGATILYVTHDQTEAMTMASRIGVIDRGRLVQIGTPREIYENPFNAYVAQRLGQPAINLVDAGLFPDLAIPQRTATLGLRTEHVAIARVGGAARGEGRGLVRRVEHLGDQNHIHVELDGTPLVLLADADSDIGAGDRVDVRPERPLFFDREGARL